MLSVAAAGNSGRGGDEGPHFPSSYASGNVLAVASTTSKGGLSGFSRGGAGTVDLAAPGSRICSTVPGQGCRALSGTPMTTPHVNGLAARVWVHRPAQRGAGQRGAHVLRMACCGP